MISWSWLISFGEWGAQPTKKTNQIQLKMNLFDFFCWAMGPGGNPAHQSTNHKTKQIKIILIWLFCWWSWLSWAAHKPRKSTKSINLLFRKIELIVDCFFFAAPARCVSRIKKSKLFFSSLNPNTEIIEDKRNLISFLFASSLLFLLFHWRSKLSNQSIKHFIVDWFDWRKLVMAASGILRKQWKRVSLLSEVKLIWFINETMNEWWNEIEWKGRVGPFHYNQLPRL